MGSVFYKNFSNHVKLQNEIYCSGYSSNPLSPYDALKHHFTSFKTHLIFLELRVLEGKFR